MWFVLLGSGFLNEEEAGRGEDDGHDFGHGFAVVFPGGPEIDEVLVQGFEIGGFRGLASEGEGGEFFEELVGGFVVIEIGAVFPGFDSGVEELFEGGAFFRIKGTFDFNPVEPEGRSGIGVFAWVLELIDVSAGRVDGVVRKIFAEANRELGAAHGLAGAEDDGLRLLRSAGHL